MCKHSKRRHISQDLVVHFEWRHQVNKMEKEILLAKEVSIVSTDDLVPLGARTSAGAVVISGEQGWVWCK